MDMRLLLIWVAGKGLPPAGSQWRRVDNPGPTHP